MKIIKYLVPIIPILIIVDFKIPLSTEINIGLKEIIFLIFAFLEINKKTFFLLFRNKHIGFFVLFVLLTYLNNFLLDNIFNSYLYLFRISEGIILAIAIHYYLRLYPVNLLYKSIIISSVILSLQILTQSILGTEVSKSLGGIDGIWISFALLILYFKFEGLTWPRLIKVFLFVFLLICSYFSEGRTWFMITIILIGIDFLKGVSQLRFIFVSILLVFCLFFYSGIAELIFQNEKMGQLVLAIRNLDIFAIESLNSRMTRWNNITDDIYSNWLLGVGYGNIDLGLADWMNQGDNPDNLYLEIWLQNGVFALLIYLYLLLRGIKTKMGISKGDTKIVRNYFLLLILGGITWGYLEGFGSLILAIIIGISSTYNMQQFNLPAFNKKTIINQ